MYIQQETPITVLSVRVRRHWLELVPALARGQRKLELELIQSHMTQKPMLRGEVGARALRNQEGRGKGRKVVHTSELVAAWWGARACMCCRAPGAP